MNETIKKYNYYCKICQEYKSYAMFDKKEKFCKHCVKLGMHKQTEPGDGTKELCKKCNGAYHKYDHGGRCYHCQQGE